MLITLIFGVLAVVLLVGGLGVPSAQRSPSIRVGLWFFAVAAALIALGFFVAAIRS